MPKTMKAAVVERFGEPLTIRDLPVSRLDTKVWDSWLRAGLMSALEGNT